VLTNTRKDYVQECSNVGQLLKNLSFELKDESTMMGYVLDDKMKPEAAAKKWLKDNPGKLDTWLRASPPWMANPALRRPRPSSLNNAIRRSATSGRDRARPGLISIFAGGSSLSCLSIRKYPWASTSRRSSNG
jgi:ABC-type proline/glycine betaine transport systems, periplasmic components